MQHMTCDGQCERDDHLTRVRLSSCPLSARQTDKAPSADARSPPLQLWPTEPEWIGLLRNAHAVRNEYAKRLPSDLQDVNPEVYLMEVDVALRQFIRSFTGENHHAVCLLSDVSGDQIHAWKRKRHKK